MPARVVLIGVDSADYAQVKRMCALDLLPNIKRFQKFYLGEMRAPIPPHTAASWTSIFTGTNPGKHGIFYFKDVHTDRVVSSIDVHAPYVWDLAGTRGKRSIVVNVPLTHPVRKLNGIMISGVHATMPDETSVYPESLLPSVRAEYKFELEGINLFYAFSRDPIAACKRLLDDEESRVAYFCKLLSEQPWDLACIVLTSLDRIQHSAWNKKHPSEPLSEFVADSYRRIDGLVGRVLDSVADYPDCVTLLASDHGFEEKVGTVYINTILERAGLLAPKSTTDKFESKITDFALNSVGPKIPKRAADLLIRLANRLTPFFRGLLSGSNRFDVPPIDYSRTLAYAYSYGLVVVNLKGRNPFGIVEPPEREAVARRVARALSEAPLDGSNLKLNAILSPEYYSGSKFGKAPDLVVEPVRGYYLSCRVGPKPVVLGADGEHSTAAVLGVMSGDLRNTPELKNPHVWDVGASILALLGFQVPQEIDGRPLFASIHEPAPGAIIEYAGARSQVTALPYSRQEEEVILARMKDMGYE